MLLPIFSLAFSLMLAVILLTAASHKLRTPQRFARQLEAYALLPGGLIGPAARVLPVIEIAIALALLLPSVSHHGGAAAAGLLSLYTAAITLNLWRGRRDIDCGCSGPGLERPLDASLIVRNGVLTAMAIVVALRFGPASVGGFGVFLIVAFVVSALMLYAATEGLLTSRSRLINPSSGR